MRKILIAALFLLNPIFFQLSFAQKQKENLSIKHKDLVAPDTLNVLFTTTKGNFVIQAYRNWAPLAADRFYTLVKQQFYTNNYFFRVEKDYVVQFGIAGRPKEDNKWDQQRLPDEPVRKKHLKTIVAFARSGKNTRTTQLFVNMQDNPKLDTTMREGVHGYPPFGKVISGMDVLFKLNGKYRKQILPLQDSVYKWGNAYLDKNFPGLDKIISATIIR